jgi:hypothetical protein
MKSNNFIYDTAKLTDKNHTIKALYKADIYL